MLDKNGKWQATIFSNKKKFNFLTRKYILNKKLEKHKYIPECCIYKCEHELSDWNEK